MKLNLFALLCLSVLTFTSCTQQNQSQTREELHKAGDEAKKAGSELKQDARELSKNIDHAVTPDTRSAEQKLADGKEKLEAADNKASTTISEAALAAHVKTNLANDAGLATLTGIEVDATGSVIRLRGHVGTKAQKDMAAQVATAVDGVTRVDNQLTVDH